MNAYAYANALDGLRRLFSVIGKSLAPYLGELRDELIGSSHRGVGGSLERLVEHRTHSSLIHFAHEHFADRRVVGG